jgi:type IV pilus assembly protein PilV
VLNNASAESLGFTLIEVLVAIVIFAFGILGFAGLQLGAIQGTRGADLRTVAALQGNDLADRMRSNMLAVQAGDYTGVAASKQNCRAVYYVGTAAPGTCTPTQLAQDDLYDWNQANAGLLPGGVGILCRDSSPNPGDRTPANPQCDGLVTSAFLAIVWWNEEVPRQGVIQRYVEFRFEP